MLAYYNEWDAPAAAWLRELGEGHHLPVGHVDTRSIRDVRANELAGYGQCHFFAGIGGWPLALRWAGLGNMSGIWTGSPPCQPFSVAGKGLAQSDDRHLAPVWLDLIHECRPPILFGEQVADAIKSGWLDDLFDALEREGYACGAAVLPACCVGAPHIRKRLFFGAVRVAEPSCEQHNGARGAGPSGWTEHSDRSAACWMADPLSAGRAEWRTEPGRGPIAGSGAAGGLADTDDTRPQGRPRMSERADKQPARPRGLEGRPANSHHGFWTNADWLGCRDGKFRPVEPSTQPLAHGLPARVGRLRGYGNAIVPQVAATFITAFLGAFADTRANL